MNRFILLVFLLVTGNSLYAQTIKPIVFKRGKTAYVEHLKDKKTKNRKYAMDKFSSEFNHTIHLTNGSVVGGNSDILKDAESGRYYLYFIDENGGLRKIFPDDTMFILHSNP